MERGFLDSAAKKKSVNDKDELGLHGLVAQVKKIDGKLLGKDGKPLRALRRELVQQQGDYNGKEPLNPNSVRPDNVHDSLHSVLDNECEGDKSMRSKPHNPLGVPLKPILKSGKVTANVPSPRVKFHTKGSSEQIVHNEDVLSSQADSFRLNLNNNTFLEKPHTNNIDPEATKIGSTTKDGSFAGMFNTDNLVNEVQQVNDEEVSSQSKLNTNASSDKPQASTSNPKTTMQDSSKNGSYAGMFKQTQPSNRKVIKISHITTFEEASGADVVIPKEAVDEVRAHFSNTLYGYFLGKNIAFPIVERYVLNTWAKYGIERVIMRNGFYLFKFKTKEGMEQVLEHGCWTIRLSPIILNVWNSNTKLVKEEVSTIPVWVKFHTIPVVAYSDVGLSHITSKIGKPIMFDSYTCDMCINPWGKSNYARALIEMAADRVFKDSLVVAIPLEDGTGHSMETIGVEYEWKPPHCAECKIFGHNINGCPKRVTEAVPSTSNTIHNPTSKSATKANSGGNKADKEGFIEVNNRRKKGKSKDSPTRIDGIKLTQTKASFYQGTKKPQSKMVYRPKATTSSSGNEKNATPTGNSFNALSELVDEGNVDPQSTNDNVQSEPSVQTVVKENLVTPAVISEKPSTDYYDRSSFFGLDDDMPSTSYNNLECINESDTDDEGEFSSFGGGNQLEEEDLYSSDGYEAQVFDLPGQLKNFRDFKLSMSGRK